MPDLALPLKQTDDDIKLPSEQQAKAVLPDLELPKETAAEPLPTPDSSWTHDEIEDIFRPTPRDVPPLQLQSESPPSYRDFTMDDPLGMGQHAKERSDENLAGRQVVEEMMQLQDDMNRNTNSVNQRIFDAMEMVIIDGGNDYRRIDDMTSALERSRTTLTDVNI